MSCPLRAKPSSKITPKTKPNDLWLVSIVLLENENLTRSCMTFGTRASYKYYF